MKHLTAEYLRECVTYDPLTGIFTANKACRKYPKGVRRGALEASGYRLMSIDDKSYREHRLVFLYMTGKWPEHTVDHINRIKDDNRWENLRDVTQVVNMSNKSTVGLSGHFGVHWHKPTKKWRVRLTHNDIRHHVGGFDTVDEALVARESFYKGIKNETV